MVGWDSLQNGECFNEALETDELQVELVPCDSNWQYRVLNSFTVSGSIFPSDIELDRQAFAKCDPRYTLALFPQEFWLDWRVTCLQESFGLSLTDPSKLDRLVGSHSLRPEECFNDAPETEDLLVELIPCSGQWQYRVLNSFTVGGSIFPSDMELDRQAYANCDPRYTLTLFPEEFWPNWRVTCLQESFGLSQNDPGKLDRLVGWDFLQNGECFNDAPETDDLLVELVPCDSNWQYRVLNSFTVGGSIFPSDVEFERQGYANCDPRYTLTLFPEENWPNWRVACIQESFGLSLTDPAKLDRLVSLESLEAGQCFNEAPETMDLQVEMVDCSESWEYQVVNIISVPTSSAYPGDSYFQDRADRDCDSL